MVKLTRELVHNLRNQGKTFSDIARMYEKSKQYVHALYTGYSNVYRKTDRAKMYYRHRGHTPNTKLTKPCDYCKSMSNSSIRMTNVSF